jgi:MoaA/NifB/PqqE/SkfB family radical SAM enzyme
MDVANERKWQLLQLESAIACNLNCLMCPWKQIRKKTSGAGIMDPGIWTSVRPHLSDIRSIDFTGGGEPLLQPRLADWVSDAGLRGCETGILTNGLLLTPKKARDLIQAKIDWICISVDGATAEVYNRIREKSDFDEVCRNIANLAAMRKPLQPKIMINYVLMEVNFHQIHEMVELASRLGVDQINFKQCDVIRADDGRGLGLFAEKENKTIRKLKKELVKARRRARKLRIHTTAFDFTPEEQAVCDQDPRRSMFVRCDGKVSPCINLAYGGPTDFLGQDAFLPTVHYGRIPDQGLSELWETEICRAYRERFTQRTKIYERALLKGLTKSFGSGRERTFKNAQKAMPAPPEGCEVCHYLYNI